MSVLVKNLMEDMVERKFRQIVPQLNCCTCDICKTDIMCYALNRLKPKYVATSQGELLSRIDSLSSTFEIAIMTELTAGAEIVRKNPRHNTSTE
ncbi:MAG: late competence development ComFB family protein [Lachnospiraceae bacterium]|nr:late competence development ComFB family protein [Lachnospiraceae bacterium]